MKINRWIVVFLGVIAIATSVAALCRACDRRVVESECSEVYRRYKDRDNLSVAFVKDYRIGDSIIVDVTTITAPDSASWEQLLREMNMNEIIIRKLSNMRKKGIRGFHMYYCEKNHPDIRVIPDEKTDCSFVVSSPADRVLYVFDIEHEEQSQAIIYEKIKKIIYKKQK